MKPATTIAAILCSLMSLMHLLRYFQEWSMHVGNIEIPVWISLPTFFILAILAFFLWKEAKK